MLLLLTVPVKMFTFRQFKIDDTHCAMKVGTDGVLLGAWTDVTGVRRILDIGCGSGLIALMLAQRAAGARVDGVEIDADAAADALANVEASPFHDRMRIFCGDVLKMAGGSWPSPLPCGKPLFTGESQCSTSDPQRYSCVLQQFMIAPQLLVKAPQRTYDCIVANPPYHEEELLPPSRRRAAARHTAGGGLTFAALLQAARQLLDADSPAARFCVILPATAVARFIPAAAVYGFNLARRTNVVTRPGKPCKRVLLDFRLQAPPPVTDELVLVAPDGGRSAQYAELCREFYL